jgi:hypothetical protein
VSLRMRPDGEPAAANSSNKITGSVLGGAWRFLSDVASSYLGRMLPHRRL